jgi:hypothetical protein
MTRVRVVDTKDAYGRAIKQRKVFYGSVGNRDVKLSKPWPSELVHIGKCVGSIYWSDKALSRGKWEIYKHIAEAGQDLFINPETTTLLDPSGNELIFDYDGSGGENVISGCEVFRITSPMPKYISELAEDQGIQAILKDGSYYEIRLPKAMWGSGINPETDETFLVVYSKEGIHFLITGVELDITEDGIVG